MRRRVDKGNKRKENSRWKGIQECENHGGKVGKRLVSRRLSGSVLDET